MRNKKLFPDEKIIVTEHFDVHQDWEVPIPAFFIIASIRKIRSVEEFNDEEAGEFIKLVRRIRKGMKEVLKIKDVYLFQNEDTKHDFHLWLFPRYEWMEKFGRKIESVRPIINHSKENMTNDRISAQVKKAVKQMKEYMNTFY
ncbi:MAG: diadenosine tetraphosphate hydrolase [Candidatus Aenigmarchaeota archaeon]|nr:diadenosine tetraphosphate hydrolase [Candidatus Aenigmarchaeota archaeon]